MKWAYSTAFLAMLAAPGALAAPSAPKAASASASGKKVGSFRTPVKHRLHEEGRLGKNAHTKRGSGQDEVDFGSYWFSPVTAGGQAVTVLLDTGSADLWLLGPNVSADQKQGQQIYDPSQSSTSAQLSGESFNIGYGEGGNGVSGPVYSDNFAVGTAEVDGMPIGVADSLTGLPAGIFKSGIMGLAFQGGNSVQPNQQPTFMEALEGALDQPIFTCNFKMGGGGYLEFGAVDSSSYTGDLITLQADNSTTYPASWSSEGVSYVSNGNTLGTFDIVFDTGGPGTSGPIAVVDAFYAQISGAVDVNGDGSSWTVPCDTDMPDLEFHFQGGAIGTIPGPNLIQNDNGDGSCSTWFNKENSPTRGLVGDAFFNSNVVVFNQNDVTISWAPQA